MITELWDLIRERWKIALLGLGVVSIALVWAVFPSIQGGAPDRLTTGPLVVSEVTCGDCRYFDVSTLDVEVEEGTYSETDLNQVIDSGDPIRWALLDRSRPAILDFSVGNSTDDQHLLIRAIELELLSYEEETSELSLACLPPGDGEMSGGIPAEAIYFTMAMEPGLEGNSRIIEHERGSAVGLELPPSQLQAYRGELNMDQPGIYTLGVSMEYQTASGQTRQADSALLDIVIIDRPSSVTLIPPETEPECESGDAGTSIQDPSATDS